MGSDNWTSTWRTERQLKGDLLSHPHSKCMQDACAANRPPLHSPCTSWSLHPTAVCTSHGRRYVTALICGISSDADSKGVQSSTPQIDLPLSPWSSYCSVNQDRTIHTQRHVLLVCSWRFVPDLHLEVCLSVFLWLQSIITLLPASCRLSGNTLGVQGETEGTK